MRTLAAILALGSGLALVACGGGDASPSATARVSPSVTTITRTATPPFGTPTPPSTTATAPVASATPAPTGESGIDGSVTIGPTCPVQRIESPCPDRPYEASITVLDAAGRKVAETRSDADGRFRVALPPGAYTLVPQSTGTPPTAQEQTVIVLAGGYTSVEIAYDSGIR